jgi:hypothetical protein
LCMASARLEPASPLYRLMELQSSNDCRHQHGGCTTEDKGNAEVLVHPYLDCLRGCPFHLQGVGT